MAKPTAETEAREARALARGEEAVGEREAEAAMRQAEKLRDETFDPVIVPRTVEPDVDPSYEVAVPDLVEARGVNESPSTQKRIEAARRQADETQKKMNKGPFDRNVFRPPGAAMDDLIREEKGTTDEYRVAASERNQEEALDDLHLRRAHKLPDEEVARNRSASRAARNKRAEEIVRRENRRDALTDVEERLKVEGDSLAIAEPDHVSRAKHAEESQLQAEADGVRRRTPATPEPHHERGRDPGER